MSDYITVDFSRVENPPQRRDKLTRSRKQVGTSVEKKLPDVNEVAPGNESYFPDEQLEAIKATFTASGGNIAETARTHSLDTKRVTALAAEHNWPVYGHGTTLVEKQRRTRLTILADTLENKLFQLADAMGVETKAVDSMVEKGYGSKYVAPLTQRSSAFSAVFDRYMRVMALLEPEVFGHDDDPSNPVASRLRQRKNLDALGGVDGIDRQMAEFAGRVAASAVKATQEGEQLPESVTEAEVVE